jgi:hypothetical protein
LPSGMGAMPRSFRVTIAICPVKHPAVPIANTLNRLGRRRNSDAGATAFCAIRSYLLTMRKQGRSLLDALAAVFQSSPFPVAWEPTS